MQLVSFFVKQLFSNSSAWHCCSINIDNVAPAFHNCEAIAVMQFQTCCFLLISSCFVSVCEDSVSYRTLQKLRCPSNAV